LPCRNDQSARPASIVSAERRDAAGVQRGGTEMVTEPDREDLRDPLSIGPRKSVCGLTRFTSSTPSALAAIASWWISVPSGESRRPPSPSSPRWATDGLRRDAETLEHLR